MQNFFYKCHRPIFREPYSGVFKPYSGVFKPYSDVLKPYSDVRFPANFFVSVIAPYSGCPIVAFLSPKVTF